MSQSNNQPYNQPDYSQLAPQSSQQRFSRQQLSDRSSSASHERSHYFSNNNYHNLNRSAPVTPQVPFGRFNGSSSVYIRPQGPQYTPGTSYQVKSSPLHYEPPMPIIPMSQGYTQYQNNQQHQQDMYRSPSHNPSSHHRPSSQSMSSTINRPSSFPRSSLSSSSSTSYSKQSTISSSIKYRSKNLAEKLVTVDQSHYNYLFYVNLKSIPNSSARNKLTEQMKLHEIVISADIYDYQDLDVLLIELYTANNRNFISKNNLIPYRDAPFYIKDPESIFVKCPYDLVKTLRSNNFEELDPIFQRYGSFNVEFQDVKVPITKFGNNSKSSIRKDIKIRSGQDFITGVVKNNETFVAQGKLFLKIDLKNKIEENQAVLDILSDSDDDIRLIGDVDNKTSLSNSHTNESKRSETPDEIDDDEDDNVNSVTNITSVLDEDLSEDDENEFEKISPYSGNATQQDRELNFRATRNNTRNTSYREQDSSDSDIELLDHQTESQGNQKRFFSDEESDQKPKSKPTIWDNLKPEKFQKSSPRATKYMKTDYNGETSTRSLIDQLGKQVKEIDEFQDLEPVIYSEDEDGIEVSFAPSPLGSSSPPSASLLKGGKFSSKSISSKQSSSSIFKAQSSENDNEPILDNEYLTRMNHSNPSSIKEGKLSSNYLLLHEISSRLINNSIALLKNQFIKDIIDRITQKTGLSMAFSSSGEVSIDEIYYNESQQVLLLLMSDSSSVLAAIKRLHNFFYGDTIIYTGLCDDHVANLIKKKSRVADLKAAKGFEDDLDDGASFDRTTPIDID